MSKEPGAIHEVVVPTLDSQAVFARLAVIVPEMAGPFTAGGSGEAKSVEPTVCSLADIAAYTALALQRMYGHDVSFTRVFSRADET